MAQVDDLAPVIRPAIEEESKVAARMFDETVAGPPAASGRGAAPQMMYGERLKTFVKARTPKIIDQLDGKSQGDSVDIRTR
jgi:hypothetical protein